MRKLILFVLVLLAGCASVAEPPAKPNQPEANQPIDATACLWVMVKGPKTVIEGKGLKAQVMVRNFCIADIKLTLSNATAISGGKDTKVELSFHLMVTDPARKPGVGGQVRWISVDANSNYANTQRWVTLAGGKTLMRTISWDGRGSDGEVLRRGSYDLVGAYYYTPNGQDDSEFFVYMGWQPFKIVSE